MTTYCLTKREREIMQEYLTTGKRLQDFRVLTHRTKKLDMQQIEQDMELIKQFLAKIDK
ncbi:MAG: hypothetical protein LBC12_00305 [Nitrososphaerota archaeon]|jgi:hypothetical protein|nr:hypothetical protein [Nitrososphaerota archaeon]